MTILIRHEGTSHITRWDVEKPIPKGYIQIDQIYPPVPVTCLHLEITEAGDVHLDIEVDKTWRRVIQAFHGGWTSQTVTSFGMQLGEGVFDVSSEYEDKEGSDADQS